LTSGACGSDNTGSVSVTVSPSVLIKAITPAASTVCITNNSTLLTLGTGSVGNIQWQFSDVSASGPWNIATGTGSSATGASPSNGVVTYTAAGLTTTTWFRVVLTNGVCTANTTPVVINVSTAVDGGNAYIGSPDTTSATVCTATTTPTVTTNNTVLTLANHTESGSIFWEKALVSAPNSWSAAGTANTSNTFTATGLTASTIYRAKVSNGACVVYSTSVTITVTPKPVAGTIPTSVVSTTCVGNTISLSLTGSTGTVQWSAYPTSATGAQIPEATYEVGLPVSSGSIPVFTQITENTTYFATVSTGDCFAPVLTSTKQIKVDATPSGGTVSGGGLLCSATTSGGAATVSVTGTVGKYKWQYRVDDGTWTDVPFGTGTGAISAFGNYFKSNSANRTSPTYSFTAFNLQEASSIAFRVLATDNGTCTTALYPNGVASTNSAVFTSGTPNGGSIALSVPSTTALPICSSTAAPALVVNGTIGTSLQWQKAATANPTSWTNIAGATGATLNSSQIGALTATTFFRVLATLGTGNTCQIGTTAPFAITVAPKAVKGTLTATGGNTLCNPGGVTGGTKTFTVSSDAVGNRFTLQSSPTSTFVAGSITNVEVIDTGSSYTLNSVIFTVNDIVATTFYRVFVESFNGAGSQQCTNATTATLTLTVSNAGAISSTTVMPICNGTTAALVLTGHSTGTGVTYSWQSSPTDSGPWTTVTGTAATLTTPALTQDTYFRANVIRSGCTATTSPYLVSVKPALGTISLGSSASQQLCSPNTGSTLIATIASGVTITRWERATVTITPTGGQTVSTTWAPIANETTTLSTGVLTGSTAYRAVVSDGTCTGNTPTFIVTVLKAGTVTGGTTGTQTLCPTASRTLTFASFQGTSLQWQSASVTAGGTQPAETSTAWTNISGATGTTFVATGGATGTTTWYRVLVNYATNACTTGVASITTANKSITWSDAVGCLTARPAEAPVVKAPFSVKAYPNPYTETFNLSLTTSSEDKVGIVVYDMTGRLIERRDVRPSDMVEQQIGDRYPSGVYNVVVTQGEEVKTVRVIKR
jgi:hypothetical protein